MKAYKHQDIRLPGLGAKLAYIGRRAHAWWEGQNFDPGFERRVVMLRPGHAKTLNTLNDQADFVCEAVWGPGRQAPGSANWSMHLARSLMINARARVGVFGAERGAPLRDLNAGTHWQVTGLARRVSRTQGLKLQEYGRARQRFNKPVLDGAIISFDLHHEIDQGSLLRLTYEMMKPGAKAVVVDFTSLRKNIRLKPAFATPWQGTLRQASEYEYALEQAGLVVTDIVNETDNFLPLIAKGWAGWRYAWHILSNVKDNRQRAVLLQLMSDHAAVWAERHDAMRSGQLQVSRLMVEKRG